MDNIKTIKARIEFDKDEVLAFLEPVLQKHKVELLEDIQKLIAPRSTQIEYLTLKEVLALLRIGKGALYTIINNGALSTIKIGGKRLFEKAAIENYLKEITKL